MTVETLEAALEREHREIDGGLEAFAEAIVKGERRTEPLLAAIAALRRHIYLEEEMLFPALKEAGFAAPVFVMLREHGEIWRGLDELEAQAARGADPEGMLAVCETLVGQLESHNMKEEAILYPRAEGVLSSAGNEELATFLASGTMPEGWVCARAAS